LATVDNKRAIAEMLRNDGKYDGDPQLAAIYSYVNDAGVLTAAIYYPSADIVLRILDLYTSPSVHDPQVLWTAYGGLSSLGSAWIKQYGGAND